MSKLEDPGTAMIALVTSPESREVLVGLSEATIDQFLADGFLRDVPLLGSVVGLVRSIGGVSG